VHGRRDGGGGDDDNRGAMTTTATATAMNVAAVAQLCGGRRGRKAQGGPRVDLRWARLLRLAVVSRVLRIVRDQLLACSSCGGGGGGGGGGAGGGGARGRGGRYRRLGPPPHAGAAVLVPVDRDDDCADGAAAPCDASAPAADGENVVSLKVSLLGDCHIGKTSFMVIHRPYSSRPSPPRP
jgi:Rab family protein